MASLCLAVALLCGHHARADEGDVFNDHYQRAVSLYKVESYQQAIREFQAAYELRQLPRLLLNIGQAHRKLGHAREALGCYELYLRAEPNPAPEIKSELETYIKQTRALLNAAERLRSPPPSEDRADPPEAPPGPRTAPPAAPAPDGEKRLPLTVAAAPPVKRPAARVAKWVLLGLGLGAAAAGATLWSLHGSPTCSLDAGQTHCPQLMDTRLGGVSLVAGGGLSLGLSALFFGLDARWQRQDAPPTALAVITGRF